MNAARIPTTWTRQPGSDVAMVIQGQSPPRRTYNGHGEGLPFFQGKAEFGSLSPTIVKWCTEPTEIAFPGDVLISIRASVGPTNLSNVECCIGRGIAAIRPYDRIPAKLLLYFLRYNVSLLARHHVQGNQWCAVPKPLRCRTSRSGTASHRRSHRVLLHAPRRRRGDPGAGAAQPKPVSGLGAQGRRGRTAGAYRGRAGPSRGPRLRVRLRPPRTLQGRA